METDEDGPRLRPVSAWEMAWHEAGRVLENDPDDDDREADKMALHDGWLEYLALRCECGIATWRGFEIGWVSPPLGEEPRSCWKCRCELLSAAECAALRLPEGSALPVTMAGIKDIAAMAKLRQGLLVPYPPEGGNDGPLERGNDGWRVYRAYSDDDRPLADMDDPADAILAAAAELEAKDAPRDVVLAVPPAGPCCNYAEENVRRGTAHEPLPGPLPPGVVAAIKEADDADAK